MRTYRIYCKSRLSSRFKEEAELDCTLEARKRAQWFVRFSILAIPQMIRIPTDKGCTVPWSTMHKLTWRQGFIAHINRWFASLYWSNLHIPWYCKGPLRGRAINWAATYAIERYIILCNVCTHTGNKKSRSPTTERDFMVKGVCLSLYLDCRCTQFQKYSHPIGWQGFKPIG